MQKDTQKTKGETQQQKIDQPKQEPTTKEGHKLKQVGHDINANLKENVGIGVGNYPSGVDREKSKHHEKRYDEKKQKEEFNKREEKGEKKLKEGESGAFSHKVQEVGHNINANLKENVGIGVGNYPSGVDREKAKHHEKKYDEKKQKEEFEKKEEKREKKLKEGETGAFSHKVQELGHNINANLKQNVGIGLGNYSSEVDREKATEHREKYEEKVDREKEKLEEKKEEMKEKVEQQKGETGIYGHRLQEVGHNINAGLKENIGIGIGDYPSEVDRKKATEHRELYEEKVKEESKPEVTDSSSLGHKIKEVAHTVNANLKEMIGIGVGNYSSEVDRELANIHKEKYEEKVQQTGKVEEFSTKDEQCLHNDDKCTHREKKFESKESKEGKFEDTKQKSGSGENKL